MAIVASARLGTTKCIFSGRLITFIAEQITISRPRSLFEHCVNLICFHRWQFAKRKSFIFLNANEYIDNESVVKFIFVEFSFHSGGVFTISRRVSPSNAID